MRRFLLYVHTGRRAALRAMLTVLEELRRGPKASRHELFEARLPLGVGDDSGGFTMPWPVAGGVSRSKGAKDGTDFLLLSLQDR